MDKRDEIYLSTIGDKVSNSVLFALMCIFGVAFIVAGFFVKGGIALSISGAFILLIALVILTSAGLNNLFIKCVFNQNNIEVRNVLRRKIMYLGYDEIKSISISKIEEDTRGGKVYSYRIMLNKKASIAKEDTLVRVGYYKESIPLLLTVENLKIVRKHFPHIPISDPWGKMNSMLMGRDFKSKD